MAAIHLLVLAAIFVWGCCDGATIEDYCAVNTQTTPCLTGCARSEHCGENCEPWVALTDKQRQEVLDTHNQYREGVASGQYAAHQLPACVGGIKAMSYSLELEFLAACWINQCKFAHDKMRRNCRDECVGQNLHQIYASVILGWPANFIANGIGRWFQEYLKLTPAHAHIVHNFLPNKGTGHLTAMLWGDTDAVGCAVMHYRQPRRGQPEVIDHAYSLYCNYAPCGNWRNTPVYKNKTCARFNKRWPHLCGEIRPVKADTFVAPEVGGARKHAHSRSHKEAGLGGILTPRLLQQAVKKIFH